MKRITILFAGMLLFGLNPQAQKIYIRGGFGIAVSTAASNNYNYSTPDNSATVATSNKKGIGTGLPFFRSIDLYEPEF